MNCAIVVAGGVGQRMGLGFNKAFANLAGQPVILYTLKNFENCPEIDSIVIAAGNPTDGTAEQDCKQVNQLVIQAKLRKIKAVVAGAVTRMQSVAQGLRAASLQDEDIVLVQDAARPFTPPDLISRMIAQAKEFGAAVCGTTPKDTIQQLDRNGFTTSTYDRRELAAVFTPVAVRWALLQKARAKALQEGILDTPGFEDSALLQRAGIKVRLVPCGHENIKITTPEDLRLAETLLTKQMEGGKIRA